jgi:dTDP-4-dehydrorhamnose reductase
VPDLVHASLDLLLDDAHGVWHLANPGPVSWAELLRRAAAGLRYDSTLVEGVPARSLIHPAWRPSYSALGSVRGERMPTLDDALERFAYAVGERHASALVERAVGS